MPEGIIFVEVVITVGMKRCKIFVQYVKSGKYATRRPDVAFVVWKANVANAR